MKALIKVRLNLAIIILSVFLIGCGVKNVAKDYSLDDKKGKGLVIVSLTRSGISNCNLFVQLRGVDNNYKADVPVTDIFASSDFSKAPLFGEIPENKPCGRLAVLELSQGEYEFYSWHGTGGNVASMQATTHFSKRFKVVSGRAVYVGNLHFSIDSNYYNVNTSDMSMRDLPLLYKKCPNITQDKVTVSILQ